MGTRKLPRKPDRMPGKGGGGFDTLNGQHPIQYFSSLLHDSQTRISPEWDGSLASKEDLNKWTIIK